MGVNKDTAKSDMLPKINKFDMAGTTEAIDTSSSHGVKSSRALEARVAALEAKKGNSSDESLFPEDNQKLATEII